MSARASTRSRLRWWERAYWWRLPRDLRRVLLRDAEILDSEFREWRRDELPKMSRADANEWWRFVIDCWRGR